MDKLQFTPFRLFIPLFVLWVNLTLTLALVDTTTDQSKISTQPLPPTTTIDTLGEFKIEIFFSFF